MRLKTNCLNINTIGKIFIILITCTLPLKQSIGQYKNTTTNDIIVRIPTVSLVDFAGSEKRSSYASGNGAQQIITPSTLDKTWLNYSSITDGKTTNVISVNLTTHDLPAEVVVKLSVGPDAGAGGGKMGIPAGTIQLTPYPQDIIMEIGSCFTGRGVKKGHQLSYSWEYLEGVDKSEIENLEVGVMFTIANSK